MSVSMSLPRGVPLSENGYSKRGDRLKGVPTIDEGEWRSRVARSMRGFTVG